MAQTNSAGNRGPCFNWPVRIYYEDTDAGGLVYHANYLRFMDRARSEWLRSLGYEQDAMMQEQELLFAVRSAALEYKKPARFNDLLHVSVSITRLGNASLSFFHTIVCQNSKRKGDMLATGSIELVMLDAMTFRPKPIPRQLKQDMKSAC